MLMQLYEIYQFFNSEKYKRVEEPSNESEEHVCLFCITDIGQVDEDVPKVTVQFVWKKKKEEELPKEEGKKEIVPVESIPKKETKETPMEKIRKEEEIPKKVGIPKKEEIPKEEKKVIYLFIFTKFRKMYKIQKDLFGFSFPFSEFLSLLPCLNLFIKKFVYISKFGQNNFIGPEYFLIGNRQNHKKNTK